MEKKTFVINPHSVIDVITNSSTEIFVMNGDKTVDAINEILKEFYDNNPHITCRIWAEEEPINHNYSAMEAFGFYGIDDIVEKIDGLKSLGFKLTEEQEKWLEGMRNGDEDLIPKCIIISHDRDYFDNELSHFIQETFGEYIEHHDTDA